MNSHLSSLYGDRKSKTSTFLTPNARIYSSGFREKLNSPTRVK